MNKSIFKGSFVRGLLFVLFALVSVSAIAQKKLNEKIKEARDEGSNYVVMASGDKKEIKSCKFPTSRKDGKIEFSDGTTTKFKESDIQAVQTDEAYYKFLKYSFTEYFAGTSGLATRRSKGVYNVFQLLIYYSKGFNEHGSTYLYFFEKADKPGMVQLQNDKKMVDYVDSLVSKSKLARASIDQIRKRYGLPASTGFTVNKLAETIELYNKDAAEGKLEN
jgi:hypothetical protein